MISDKANVFDSAKLGENVKVGAYAEVGRDVVVGDNTNISAGVFIPENVVLEDNVFVGPHAVFTNDKNPPSFGYAPGRLHRQARLFHLFQDHSCPASQW